MDKNARQGAALRVRALFSGAGEGAQLICLLAVAETEALLLLTRGWPISVRSKQV